MSEQANLANMSETERRIADKIDQSIAGGLAVTGRDGGVQFQNAAQVMEMAKMMAVSGVAVPKYLRANPGACLAVVIQAVEWRMSPYAVANKSYSVNDRLAYESQLVQAVILQRAPIRGRFRFDYDGAGTSRRCTVTVKTNDGDEVSLTTPPVGDIPVKNSPLWKGDPDQQLSYYAGRALCRRYFPDVILGVYTADEIDMYEPRDPMLARDITPTPSTQTIAGKLDALAAPLDSREKQPSQDHRAIATADDAAAGDAGDTAAPSDPADRSNGGQEAEGATAERRREDQREPKAQSATKRDSAKEAPAPGSKESREAAYQRGMSDAQNGAPKRAVPKDYAGDEFAAERLAWNKGWDAANDAAGGDQ